MFIPFRWVTLSDPMNLCTGGLAKRLWLGLMKFFLCCCSPMLPELASSIHATWPKPFRRPLYYRCVRTWLAVATAGFGVLGGGWGVVAVLAWGLWGVRTFSGCSSPRTRRPTAAQSRKHVAITFPDSLKMKGRETYRVTR